MKEPTFNLIPTKLSLMEHSSDYCRMFDVYFNDVKQTLCVHADVTKGVICRYKANAVGVLSKNRQGKLITETLEGVVRIVKKPGSKR